MKSRKKRKASQQISVAAVLLLLAALVCGIFFAQRSVRSEVIEEAGMSVHADHSGEYLLHEGTKYPVKDNLSTLLLIGIDSFEEDEDRIVEGENRNRDLADFLVVLVLDHNKKTVTPLQLNRDTICEVPWLDERGHVGGYRAEHLTYAHTYGSGKEDSCVNTVRAVRSLLNDAPIRDYMAFSMDAVPIINDLVGGVTLTLTEDLTALNKDYVKGAEITLKGKNALRFVRYREKIGGSNLYRMKRHRLYLNGFLEASRAAMQDNQDLALDIFKKVNPYLCTDLSAEKVSTLVEQLSKYEILEILTPSGDARPGEKFYEFYVHPDSLWSCVQKAFCAQSEDNSGTPE